MNSFMKILGFTATLALMVLIPLYLWHEPEVQGQIQFDRQVSVMIAATDIYAENCAVCHGGAGEGIGTIPALDSDALRTMPEEEIFKVIMRGRSNTQMAAWGQEEGGILTYAEVQDMVTFILNANWGNVEQRVADLGLTPPEVEVLEVSDEMIANISALEGGETLTSGLLVYAENCAACHASNGAGTAIAPALNTEEVRAQTAEDLQATINNGVAGTLMASWANTLTTEETGAVIEFLLRWPEVESSGIEFPEAAVPTFPSTPEMIAAGDQLFHVACKSCHGVEAYGSPMAPALNTPTFLADTPDAAIYQIIAGGIPGTLMPAWGSRLSETELQSLVAFLRSLEDSGQPILQQ